MRARRWRRAALWLVLLLAGLALLLGVDLRAPPHDAPPRIVRHQDGHGELRVGAGVSEIAVPFPVVAAGYGPKDRHAVRSARQPQRAQAISLAVGDARLTLVAVDLLEIDSSLPGELRARLPGDAGEVWLCATHTHSGMGNYDPNPLAQLAGTGRFHPDARAALTDAIVAAVAQATSTRTPSRAVRGSSRALPVVNRDDPHEQPTEPLTTLDFPEASARLTAVPAHPTLIARSTPVLDADFPGTRLDDRTAALWLQGAAGDLAVDRRSPGTFSEALVDAAHAAGTEVRTSELSTATAEVALPPVEVHAAPEPLRRAASTLVDRFAAPRTAELAIARLGEVTLVAVPGEPTQRAGGAIRVAVGDPDAVVLGLCNGYVGYIETSARVVLGTGETRRQEFDASLLDRFTGAARLAASAVGMSPPAASGGLAGQH